MTRIVKWMALCGAVVALSAPALLAADRPARPNREEMQKEMQQRMADRMQQIRDQRPLGLPESETVKAEQQRNRDVMDALMKRAKDLRDAVKKDVDGGMTQEDAVKKHLDDAKALAKEIIAATMTHFENMAKIAKDEADTLVDKLAENLLKRMEPRPAGDKPPAGEKPQPGNKPPAGEKPRQPVKDGNNPFND